MMLRKSPVFLLVPGMILSAARVASGLCVSPLPLQARVMARRKARSNYGNTSVAGRAGTFRRAIRAHGAKR